MTVDLTTRYHPSILGLSSMDFAIMAGVCFGFALTLAARTWVKLNEPSLMDMRRRQVQEQARRQVRRMEGPVEPSDDEAPAVSAAGGERP